MNLKDLNQQIKTCTKCNLREECTAPVCGLGSAGAKYFIIGEAPGKTEDEKGVPFIGAAGKKLDKLIALGNISLNDIYLTNTVKCRPPNNDKPKKRQTKTCCEWLWQELELVNPQYIITLGAVPLSLFTDVGIGKMHGTLLDIKGRKLIAQYHPAASLHQPRLWAAMLDDWENLPKQVPHSYTLKPESRIPPEILSLDTESAGEGGFTVGDWSIAYRDKRASYQ